MRWSFHPSMSRDLSRAGGLASSSSGWLTLNLTWIFDRTAICGSPSSAGASAAQLFKTLAGTGWQ